LILGAVAIATELRRPTILTEPVVQTIPECTRIIKNNALFIGDISENLPILCSQ